MSVALVAINSHAINGVDQVQSVNARDLHGFLEIGKDFSNWIKAQLGDLFAQGFDYAVFAQKGVSKKPLLEYALSMDCAKHVAMMSRTAKGKDVRAYFIECERRALSVAANDAKKPVELSKLEILEMALESERKYLEGQKVIAHMQPQVDALVRLAGDVATTLCLRDAAKHLQLKPMSIYPWLIGMKWIYKRTDNAKYVGFQDRIDAGHIVHKMVETDRSDGSTRQDPQPRVTQKGLARLACLIEKGKGPQALVA